MGRNPEMSLILDYFRNSSEPKVFRRGPVCCVEENVRPPTLAAGYLVRNRSSALSASLRHAPFTQDVRKGELGKNTSSPIAPLTTGC